MHEFINKKYCKTRGWNRIGFHIRLYLRSRRTRRRHPVVGVGVEVVVDGHGVGAEVVVVVGVGVVDAVPGVTPSS